MNENTPAPPAPGLAPDTARISMEGRVQANEARQLRVRCQAIAAEYPGRDIAVDMSQVSFLASSGVGSLIYLSEELAKSGANLWVVAPSDAVQSVLELLNLHQLVKVIEG